MKTKLAKVVGTPGKSAWAQVHTFSPQDEEARQARGELVAVIAASNIGEEQEAVSLGKEVLTRLHEEYYGSLLGSPFDALQNALKKVSEEFAGGANLEIVASVVWQEFIYFASLGGRITLWRGGKLVSLLEGGEEVLSLSGKNRGGDVFILGSKDFFGLVDTTALKEALEKSASPADVVDSVAPLLHAKNSASAAAAFVKAIEELPRDTGKEAKRNFPKSFGFKQKVRLLVLNLASRLPDREVYARKPGSRRTAFWVGLILIILLLLSIIFGARAKSIRESRSAYEDRLVRAETLYQDSILQKEVNLTQARESFVGAQALVNELVGEGVKDSRLEALKSNIEREGPSLLGKISKEPSLFLDLSLVRAGVGAQTLSSDAGVLGVLDRAGRIIAVSQKDKKTEVLAAGEGPSRGALYSGRHFYLTENGIGEVSAQAKAKIVVEHDEEWGEIAGLGAFGGNLYLLDKNGQVWRYPGIEGGFGTKQEWLGEGVEPDFSLIQDMVIDGSIWVLSTSGKVAKFTRGSPDSFSITGLDRELSEPAAIYTDENLTSLFILDKNNGRVLEIAKTGEYQKQYLWDGMGEVKDLAVGKDVGKIFLLTETKILEIPLQ